MPRRSTPARATLLALMALVVLEERVDLDEEVTVSRDSGEHLTRGARARAGG